MIKEKVVAELRIAIRKEIIKEIKEDSKRILKKNEGQEFTDLVLDLANYMTKLK